MSRTKRSKAEQVMIDKTNYYLRANNGKEDDPVFLVTSHVLMDMNTYLGYNFYKVREDGTLIRSNTDYTCVQLY